MNGVVDELAAIVGGSSSRTFGAPSQRAPQRGQQSAQKTHNLVAKHHGLSATDQTFHKIAGGPRKSGTRAAVAANTHDSVEKAIPLDDTDNSDLAEFNS